MIVAHKATGKHSRKAKGCEFLFSTAPAASLADFLHVSIDNVGLIDKFRRRIQRVTQNNLSSKLRNVSIVNSATVHGIMTFSGIRFIPESSLNVLEIHKTKACEVNSNLS